MTEADSTPVENENTSEHCETTDTTESDGTDEENLIPPASPPQQGWKRYIGILLTILASSQYALGLLIAKVLKNYHPFMLMFWRYLGMAPIIPFVIYYSMYKKKPIFKSIWPIAGNIKTIVLIWVVCFSWAVAGILLIYSCLYISMADASTITYSSAILMTFLNLQPVFVTLVSHWVLKEKTGIIPILCGILTLAGVVITTRPPIFSGNDGFDTNTLIGSSMAAGSMLLAVAAYITLRGLQHVHHSITMLTVAIWGTAQCGVMAAAVSRFELPQDRHDWLLTAALSLLFFLPQLCLVVAFKYEEAGNISLFRTFDILFAFVWQYALMGVVPDWISFLGGSIVISGVLLAALRKYVDGLPLEGKLRGVLWFILK